MSPSDMGTIESQKNTMKALLALWGLDPSTFDESNIAYNSKLIIDQDIYKSVIIPFVNSLLDKLNNRFADVYGEELVIDTSGIEALQPNLKEKTSWMVAANVFTDNEIRDAIGYDKRESDVSDMTPTERLDKESLAGFDLESLNKNVVQ